MVRNILISALFICCTSSAMAQTDATTGATTKPVESADKEKSADNKLSKLADALSRLHIGGYAEVALSRMYYSDNPGRYENVDDHRNDPSHGRFDIPHAVINIGYDFGKGWTFATEIEYEHGGSGSSYEREDKEASEWESETEKGGEVELEQLWIQKSFAQWANIRAGHIIVPVGLNNTHHEPLNFFTVYRPEGENTILPSTWHQTGISFWGRYKDFRYELQFLAGLNANNFTASGWIHKGIKSPFEFDPANKYGLAARIDNYTIKGLRLGLSAYYGHTVGNSFPADQQISKVKGVLAIGSFDFTYNAHNWIVRGQADYGHLGDTDVLNGSAYADRIDKKSPFHNTSIIGSSAYAIGVEAGYDIFSQIHKTRKSGQKFYVFGRYENFCPCSNKASREKYDCYHVQRMALGINYMPIKQIVVKFDYSNRFLESKYVNEPSINLGIAYQGWFL